MPLLKKTSYRQRCHKPAMAGEEGRLQCLVEDVLGQSYPNRDQVTSALSDPSEACLVMYENTSGLPRAVTIIDLEDGSVLHLAAICPEERDDILDYAQNYARQRGVESLDCPESLYQGSIK